MGISDKKLAGSRINLGAASKIASNCMSQGMDRCLSSTKNVDKIHNISGGYRGAERSRGAKSRDANNYMLASFGSKEERKNHMFASFGSDEEEASDSNEKEWDVRQSELKLVGFGPYSYMPGKLEQVEGTISRQARRWSGVQQSRRDRMPDRSRSGAQAARTRT